MPMNDSDKSYEIAVGNLLGTGLASNPSMNLLRVALKDSAGFGWKTVEIPITLYELRLARLDFTAWVSGKSTGPLDGSWGALMQWWMNDQRPEWKKFDVVDRVHLTYAVGLPEKKVKLV